MFLNYNALPSLPDSIRDSIVDGTVALYIQPEGFDERGTRYIMVVGDLIFRLDQNGGFIFPPLEKMPENADTSNIIELQRN